jgi:glycosyltransferase involved in cell wall biosynthesis
LKEHYYNADIFFMPSLSEGLPNSMLEAAAMELALIGSGEGGARDIIVDGKNGYYVKDPEAELFAKKVLYLYEHPKLLKEMKKNARVHMRENFQWDSIADDFVKVLEEYKEKNY